MLPDLRAEYEQAAKELQQEEADIAELQNSDKDYLTELKVSIAEQESVQRFHTVAPLFIINIYHPAAWSCSRLKLVLRKRRRR